MSFLLLGDLEEAVDFKSTWLDLVGDIRITDEELDVIISADDVSREDEYLACSGVDTTDDVINFEDDIRASGDEVSIVDDEEAQLLMMSWYFILYYLLTKY